MTSEAPTRTGRTAAAGRRTPKYILKPKWRNLRNGLLFISPWIIGTAIFTLYPVLSSVYFSFTDFNGAVAPRWVGLDNYRALFADPLFLTAVRNTLTYTVLYVPLMLLLSLGLAMLMNLSVRGISVYRTLMFAPYVLPQVGVAMLWAWILNPQVGLANSILGFFGLPSVGWLSDPNWAKPSLVMMDLWVGVGGTMIIFLAGLKSVPKQLYEAADVDGAGAWSKTWRITLPMIAPTTFYNLVLGLIGSLQVFTTAYVVSGGQGGPSDSTMFYSLLLYINAFRYFNFGYASAMAWVLFIVVFLLTLVVFRTSRKWVYYEGGD